MENTYATEDSSAEHTLTVRSGDLAFDVDVEPAVFAATLGDKARTDEEVIKGMGELMGLHYALNGDNPNADFSGPYAQAVHEATADNPFALRTLQQSLSNVQPYVSSAAHAMSNGDENLEHPVAHALLTHARQTFEQMSLVADATREVDGQLVVPVLNTMQRLGGAQTAADACGELAKLGPASNVTYGRAATDLALLIGAELESPEAIAILESEGAGVDTPQFGINATAAFAPRSLFERAESGDLAAQHALLTEGSMLFEPENEAALERLHELVNAELAQQNGSPDWKSLADKLSQSNQLLAQDAEVSRLNDVTRDSGQRADSRELGR